MKIRRLDRPYTAFDIHIIREDEFHIMVQTRYQLASQGIVMNCLETLSAETLKKLDPTLFKGNLLRNQIYSSKYESAMMNLELISALGKRSRDKELDQTTFTGA